VAGIFFVILGVDAAKESKCHVDHLFIIQGANTTPSYGYIITHFCGFVYRTPGISTKSMFIPIKIYGIQRTSELQVSVCRAV
jgi:hypothetical protein